MDMIGSMTRKEMIRVEEEMQNLLRAIDLSELAVHGGSAEFDFCAAETHASSRKRAARKKADLVTAHDTIGLMARLSTAKGGRPKVEIWAMMNMTALALMTVDDGDSMVYTARILGKAKPMDIKLGEADTSIRIQLVDPHEFLMQLRTKIADSPMTTGANNVVSSLKVSSGRRNRGRPKKASLFVNMREHLRRSKTADLFVMVLVLLASVWCVYRNAQFFYNIHRHGLEAFSCKHCYAKGVYSFFRQCFSYLFIVISMLGHIYVAAHTIGTWSGGPYPRFAAFETFRIVHDFFMEVYNYYTLPTHVRYSLTPALFKSFVYWHFRDVILVLLLLWSAKNNAGYKGLLRNVCGALLLSILMTSSYFYCASVVHAELVPGVHFQGYLDIERGFIDATKVIHDFLYDDEDATPRELSEHADLEL